MHEEMKFICNCEKISGALFSIEDDKNQMRTKFWQTLKRLLNILIPDVDVYSELYNKVKNLREQKQHFQRV